LRFAENKELPRFDGAASIHKSFTDSTDDDFGSNNGDGSDVDSVDAAAQPLQPPALQPVSVQQLGQN
jgi:hypothetical protein